MKDEVEDEKVMNINWAWKHSNIDILNICHAKTLQEFIMKQNSRWVAQVIWALNECLTKRLMSVDEKFTKIKYHHKTVYENVVKLQEACGLYVESLLRNFMKRKLIVCQQASQAGALGAEVAK